jgi:hypothetical protein
MTEYQQVCAYLVAFFLNEEKDLPFHFFLKDPANAGLRCISRGKSYNNVVQWMPPERNYARKRT